MVLVLLNWKTYPGHRLFTAAVRGFDSGGSDGMQQEQVRINLVKDAIEAGSPIATYERSFRQFEQNIKSASSMRGLPIRRIYTLIP